MLVFRGIIKNRPALGERALQELLNDNVLKFNYFLTDARGRNVKSYMKVPIPSANDPNRATLVKILAKHDINIEEYCSIYEASSIPSQNSLSKLSLELFEKSACFVAEYHKYKHQLHAVIKKHIENNDIVQLNEEKLYAQKSNMFTCYFHEIENLVSNTRSEHSSGRQSTVIPQTTASNLPLRHSIHEINAVDDTPERGNETQPQRTTKKSSNEQYVSEEGKVDVG